VERARLSCRASRWSQSTSASAVAQICWRLEGIPLALELARASHDHEHRRDPRPAEGSLSPAYGRSRTACRAPDASPGSRLELGLLILRRKLLERLASLRAASTWRRRGVAPVSSAAIPLHLVDKCWLSPKRPTQSELATECSTRSASMQSKSSSKSGDTDGRRGSRLLRRMVRAATASSAHTSRLTG